MFAAKKWAHYCDLGNLVLKLRIKGKYWLQIMGSVRNLAYNRIDTLLLEREINTESVEITIPNPYGYDGVYFSIIENEDNPVEILGGEWCTDRAPNRQNKIAIVTCTFKREDYVLNNINLLEKFLRDTPELKGRLAHFVVDNGKTLDLKRANNVTKIFPNKNAGGAGGFTRGLIEVMRSKAGFTRVLFMDDDVEILPEAFYRTLALADYLNDQFADSFINGAMFNLYSHEQFYENLSIQCGMWVRSYHPEMTAADYDNVLKINDIPASVYANPYDKAGTAWWFQCFPVEMAERDGLPLPLFLRGDDLEWGWRRNGKHHISMNGIFLWHAPFPWRVSKTADYYYSPRNLFLLNCVYKGDFKDRFEALLTDVFTYLVRTYDYVSIELLLKAMDDILKGGDAFRTDPEEKLQEVNAIARQVEYHDCYDSYELEHIRHHRRDVSKFKQFLYKVTRNGVWYPKWLMQRGGVSLEWYPPHQNFMFIHEVRVYNLNTRKFCVRRFRRGKTIRLTRAFHEKLAAIKSNYDKLRNDYLRSLEEFKTLDFWKKYLGIN